MIKLLILFAAITALDLVSSTCYLFNGPFGFKCPSDAVMVEMTEELKKEIVDSHNTKRNTLASGELENYEPAVRMATMRWDDELANLSEINAKYCKFDHDRCWFTHEFKVPGQLLARTLGSGQNISESTAIKDFIDGWWSEYTNASMANIKQFSSSLSTPIGHFTVMATDKNMALGCAAIKFKDSSLNNLDTLTFICNYAMNVKRGQAVYEAGAAGSGCTTGSNTDYASLCSPAEQYDLPWF